MRLRVTIDWADNGEQVCLPDGTPLQLTEAELLAALADEYEVERQPWYRRANNPLTSQRAEAEAIRALKQVIRNLKEQTLRVA